MSDTTITTETATEFPPLTFTVAPGSQVERHPEVAWELAHAEDKARTAAITIADLTAQIQANATEQITDGADPRLIDFWEKAGRIADYADFCEEYDRLAEAMNGPGREREYEVQLEVTVTLQVTRTVNAQDSETAECYARDDLDGDTLRDALSYNSIDEWEVTQTRSERA